MLEDISYLKMKKERKIKESQYNRNKECGEF
jgi:hypothetical protein